MPPWIVQAQILLEAGVVYRGGAVDDGVVMVENKAFVSHVYLLYFILIYVQFIICGKENRQVFIKPVDFGKAGLNTMGFSALLIFRLICTINDM